MKVWFYWDCPYCGSMIQGKHRECPHCAAPIPNNVRYMPPDDPRVIRALKEEKVILNEDAEIHVDEKGIRSEVVKKEEERTGENWLCDSCGAQNPATVPTCIGCGAPKGGKTYFNQTENWKREQGTPRMEPVSMPVRPNIQIRPALNPFAIFRSKLFKLLLAAVILIPLLMWLFKPVERKAEVVGFRWERSIAVEKFTLSHESGWSTPSGARVTKTSEEIHHYDQVVDHYETKTRQVAHQVLDGYDTSYKDLGNGQGEVVQTPRYRTEYTTETYQEPVYRSVPVYQTKYYYDIDKWVHDTDLRTSGAGQEPYWQETDIPASVSNPSYGDRRQGARTEHYYVSLKDQDNEKYETEFKYSEWQGLSIGDKLSYQSFRFSKRPINEITVE